MRTLPLLLLAGCLIQPWQGNEADTDTDADTDSDTDADTDTDTDTDTDADTDSDTDTDTDTPLPVEPVAGGVYTNLSWTNDTVYRLDGVVFVTGQLLIQAGTRIEGAFGSALVITKEGRITANGNQNAPIVFTSAQANPGPGDWGGLALLGDAITTSSADGTGELEGLIDDGSLFAEYGSDDPLNSDNNCGTLQYVRIEYPGFAVGDGDELNGLTLAGCGSGTLINNVHVHNTVDDGLEIFGGTVNVRNVILTRAGDDSFDFDAGWTGKAQFIIVQQDTFDHGLGQAPDRAIEADGKWGRTPETRPTIENITLIGTDSDDPFADGQRGMVLRENVGANMANVLMMGFTKEGIDIRDLNSSSTEAITHVRADRTTVNIEEGHLTLRGALMYDIGAGGSAVGTVWGPDEPTDGMFNESTDTASGDTAGWTNDFSVTGDDDHSFDEIAWITDPLAHNVLEQDPRIPNAYDLTNPNFVPHADSPANQGVPTSADPWFNTAVYIGAVQPGGPAWYDWTEFPEWTP